MPQILGYAVVGADGTLLHSSGVESVQHIGTGRWHVWFTFSVANACEVASLGHFEMAGWITAYGEPQVGPNEVEVMTGSFQMEIQSDGSAILVPVPGDLTFQLVVLE